MNEDDEREDGAKLGPGYPRPAFWGGYRLWIETLELWVAGEDRFHERLRYERRLAPRDTASFTAEAWVHQRLQP